MDFIVVLLIQQILSVLIGKLIMNCMLMEHLPLRTLFDGECENLTGRQHAGVGWWRYFILKRMIPGSNPAADT